ncbi:MAG: TonB family protein [Bacteroidales bacterium]|nr:TonB family protein [Bacteroidales bacterium]
MKNLSSLFGMLAAFVLICCYSASYAQCDGDMGFLYGKKTDCQKYGFAIVKADSNGQHVTPTSALSLPHFKGGNKAMCRYINKTKVYPVNLKSQKASGTTVVQALVKADSTLEDIHVVSTSGYQEFDDEALRVVKSFPKICPATQSCEPIDFIVQIPVTFSPEEEEAKEKLAEQKKLVKNIGPITLYFENDRPDPRTTQDVTSTDYKTLYDAYMGKKTEYVQSSGKNLSGADKSNAEGQMTGFFNDSIETGYDRLVKFTDAIVELLEDGQSVSFTISGFASPLSNSTYNQHLSSRRIESVLNYMKQAKGGALAPYIDGSKPGLTITKNPTGEVKRTESSDAVSVTVYGLAAAKDRKIVIHNLNVY